MEDQEAILYSLDEDFDELQDTDKTVELVGFISAIEAPTKAKQYDLFKFGLSNGSKKVMCLVWNKPLIDNLQPHIVLNKIMHLDEAHCKASKFPKMLTQLGYLSLEIIIQTTTKIKYLGMHELDLATPPPPVRNVDFVNIIDVTDEATIIAINGYIKTEFVSVKFGEASFARGSITDGTYKITVNNVNSQAVEFPKGTPVTVIAKVKGTTDLLTITCEDSSNITIRENVEPLTELQLMWGTRVHKRRHL